MPSTLDEIVKRLAKKVKRHPRTLLAWFDDAGAIKIGEAYYVIKVDGFAASRALYPWCSYRDFGFRGVTGAVSDVIAKGCRPLIYAISIGVKPEHVDYVEDIVRGVEEAVNIYGGYIENMDTNVGYDDWIDVFIIGECSYMPLQRSAKPLDVVILPRRVGLSAVAYIEFSRGRTPSHEEVKEFSCRPRACIDIVKVIEECRKCIDGSIDISDTFAESLYQLGEVTDVGFYINQRASEMLHPLALEYARSNGVELEAMVLASNEEYIPILIARQGYEEQLIELLRAVGLEPKTIGTVIGDKGIRWFGRAVPIAVWDYVAGAIKL
ncbi:MAG: hypothetical protein JHC33_13420 [Ignisphaera sp.]|nr:hypothetical protein [Ignisphaera sp.]